MAIEQLVWIRNDLRWQDNPALYFASLKGPIRVIVIATPKQWQEHHESGSKIGLRAGLIRCLFSKLVSLGIPADLIEVDRFKHIPDILCQYCQDNGIKHLWYNQDFPIHERQRDQAVKQALQAIHIEVHPQEPDLIVSRPVLSQQGTPFKVFTPFYKRWLTMLNEQSIEPLPIPKKQADALSEQPLTMIWQQPFRDDLWKPDQDKANQTLWQFCHRKEDLYDKQRDFPMTPGTSTLSPYLALGALGPRECVYAIAYVCNEQGRSWQDSIWLKELAWRDFYRQLMLHFPTLSKHKPFKPETDRIVWRDNKAERLAWQKGQTGFPIVDAAMRQLNQTGWMHNRLRMITASFFSKLLFADWHHGEQYFMSKLIDGEFAANNGGWQWSASTGCDAAPYFRVFNPTRQSERYDAKGEFIRRFVPELKSLDNKSIHNPSTDQRDALGYPNPIVDYKTARKAAIEAFDRLKNHHS
ncbi:Deoxyribodipyrimidine photo-lyase [Marinomonas spartinae]|uniref:Deoxyribodipyrimidine photo-lyase n=1 Tax=Marinomonas spartinae TaxID=1792290 RepID=A0A1A8T9T1_9GAMM|nr:deoxyribodipyrimidine photo-lyase [Marinomonas spartinae]SBS28176.1 Deoxyribodipyrimidine photo-lyase [Marinomonas spartinae]SBS28394.1 Deoxyribodipyrimidine photo-lyase [Marinomonas spartinae]